MKIVIIGGSGLIGTKLVNRLRSANTEVVAASLASGVDIITGEGLPGAMAGAQVVVDVANSPTFEARAALEFFETAGRNLLTAEKSAGVQHHRRVRLRRERDPAITRPGSANRVGRCRRHAGGPRTRARSQLDRRGGRA